MEDVLQVPVSRGYLAKLCTETISSSLSDSYDELVAAIPRQEFEEVCFRGGNIDSTNFSPGLIQVVSEASDRRCDFTVNRASGDAEYFSHDDYQGGQYSEMKWLMTCKKTKIPSFESVRNRF